MLSGIIKILMRHRLSSLRHNIPTALCGIIQVLRRPRYVASALVGALGFAWLIFLLTNGGFYGALLMSRLPLIDKLGVIGTMFIEIARQAATSLTGALLVLVSILQGISLALIIFTARHNKHIAHSPYRGSIFLGSSRCFSRDGCQHHCAYHRPWAQPLFALSIGPDCRHLHNISSAGGASCSQNKQGLA